MQIFKQFDIKLYCENSHSINQDYNQMGLWTDKKMIQVISYKTKQCQYNLIPATPKWAKTYLYSRDSYQNLTK